MSILCCMAYLNIEAKNSVKFFFKRFNLFVATYGDVSAGIRTAYRSKCFINVNASDTFSLCHGLTGITVTNLQA